MISLISVLLSTDYYFHSRFRMRAHWSADAPRCSERTVQNTTPLKVAMYQSKPGSETNSRTTSLGRDFFEQRTARILSSLTRSRSGIPKSSELSGAIQVRSPALRQVPKHWGLKSPHDGFSSITGRVKVMWVKPQRVAPRSCVIAKG